MRKVAAVGTQQSVIGVPLGNLGGQPGGGICPDARMRVLSGVVAEMNAFSCQQQKARNSDFTKRPLSQTGKVGGPVP